jgi:predicted thioesterase
MATRSFPVRTDARAVAVDGRRITVEVGVRQARRLLMKGRHGRAIVRLDKSAGARGRGGIAAGIED